MRADRAKQLLKNGVYRAIGETVTGAGGLDGETERTLRVLMYHKVNDVQPNATTVPTAIFAEQMGLLDGPLTRGGGVDSGGHDAGTPCARKMETGLSSSASSSQ